MGPFDGLTAVQRQQIREAHAQRKITAADLASRTDRGTCLGCGRDYQLNNDGTVRLHMNRESRRACAGSGQRPREG